MVSFRVAEKSDGSEWHVFVDIKVNATQVQIRYVAETERAVVTKALHGLTTVRDEVAGIRSKLLAAYNEL